MRVMVQNNGEQPLKVTDNPLRKGTIIEPGEEANIEFESPPEGGLVWLMEAGTEELGKLDQSEGA